MLLAIINCVQLNHLPNSIKWIKQKSHTFVVLFFSLRLTVGCCFSIEIQQWSHTNTLTHIHIWHRAMRWWMYWKSKQTIGRIHVDDCFFSVVVVDFWFGWFNGINFPFCKKWKLIWCIKWNAGPVDENVAFCRWSIWSICHAQHTRYFN